MKKIFALMLIGSGFMDVSVYAMNPVVQIKNNKENEKKAQEALEEMKAIIKGANGQETNYINTALVGINRENEAQNCGVRLKIVRSNINIIYAPNGRAQTLPQDITNKFNEFFLNQGEEANLITEIKKLKPEDCYIEIQNNENSHYVYDSGFVKYCIDNFSQLKKLSHQNITDLYNKAINDYTHNIVTDQNWKTDLVSVSNDEKIKKFISMYKDAQNKIAKGDKSAELEQFMIYCEQFMAGNGEAILELLTTYIEEKDQKKQEEAFKKLKEEIDTREMKILEEIMKHIQPNKDLNTNVDSVVRGMKDNTVLKEAIDGLKPALFDETKNRDALKEEAKAGVAEAQARRAEKRLNDFAEKLDLLLEGDKTYKKYLPGKKAEEERKAVQEILMIVNNLKADDEEINRAINDGKVSDTETANVLRESINSTWKAVKAKVDALDKTFDKKEGKNGNVKYKKGWQGKLIGMLNQAIPMNIRGNGTPTASKEETIDQTSIKALNKILNGKKIETKKKDKLIGAMNKVYALLNHEKITLADVEKIKDLHDKLEKIEFKGREAEDAKKEVMDLRNKNAVKLYNMLTDKETDAKKKEEYREEWKKTAQEKLAKVVNGQK